MILATFTGDDGSMGFRTGHRYHLHTRIDPALGIIIYDGQRACPYSSLEALLRNWKDVVVSE